MKVRKSPFLYIMLSYLPHKNNTSVRKLMILTILMQYVISSYTIVNNSMTLTQALLTVVLLNITSDIFPLLAYSPGYIIYYVVSR